MNRKDLIFIVSPRTGYIPQLSMSGPIVSPLRIEAGSAYGMVAAGVELHRYNPDNKMTVKLTLDNCYDDHMFDVVEEEPVVESVPQMDEIPNNLPTTEEGLPIIEEPEGVVPEAVVTEEAPVQFNNQNQGKKNKNH